MSKAKALNSPRSNHKDDIAATCSVVHIKCHVTAVYLPSREAVTHEAESVVRVVINLKVLAADILQHFDVVKDAACIQRRDLTLDLPVLVPRSTARVPHGPLEELLGVDIVVADGIVPDVDGSELGHSKLATRGLPAFARLT